MSTRVCGMMALIRRNCFGPRSRAFGADQLRQKGELPASWPCTQLTLRVKALETQITELEAEASRLLRALDSLKEAKADQERESSKKAEDATKEISTLTAEIDGLKSRVKQFGDYDEIKRELEIMKVSHQHLLPVREPG